MKAVLIRKHGGPEVLEIADLPKPKAEAGQVVIRVKAAGMNHLDTWVRRGLPGVTPPLPMVHARRLHPDHDLTCLRSEEHTSELQSRGHLVCRLLLEKKK